jgi:nucleotide-binding universal stress UspA family protein
MPEEGEEKRRILVAIDFSEDSASALEYAANLCKRLDDRLIILHVIHDQAGSPGYYTEQKIKGEKKRLKRLEEIADEMLTGFIEKQIDDHPEIKGVLKKAERMLVSGLTVTKILQVVEKTAPELLVLGNKGRTSLKHILLGSKAEQLARLCPIPVTLVKQ